MNSKYILAFCTLLLLSSCETKTEQITNSADYNNYLELAENKTLQIAESNKEFWTDRLADHPGQYSDLSKTASSYSHLFAVTGDIAYLKLAEADLLRLNEVGNYKNSGALMSLAGNYISQHKFKESLELLSKAELIGDHMSDINKMLFDVNLELGDNDMAKVYLEKIENMGDFDYLIRLAKWSDHQGNLDAAIKYLEKAQTIAESSKQIEIIHWTYTNLGDFYGHAGRIDDSYQMYLKALEIDPNDAYSKKGIAWIVYSYEKNADEALRILNTVTKTYKAPDYHLLKAEIYEYKGDEASKEKELKLYKEAVENEAYGAMYNKYNVLLYTDENQNLQEAIDIAKNEVKQRPTAQSYDLLAWSYFNNGDIDKALQIVKGHVVGHTSEPMALYHSAEIYKAAGDDTKADDLKREISESSYELGPIISEKVSKI
ncbi:MAG: tetratricopeptide repeat protein [Aquaticitalea sp.]